MALLVLLGALIMLLVLGGAGWPVTLETGPDPPDVSNNPDEYLGETVSFTGEVIDTQGPTVAIEHAEGTLVLTLVGVDTTDISVGDRITFAGEFRHWHTVEVAPDDYVIRATWESTYMYAISALAVVMVGLLLVDYWSFRRRFPVLVTRDRPLHHRWLGGTDDG